MRERALIASAVLMNLFVVQGARRDSGGSGDVILGISPYVAIMMAFTLLLMVFPRIVTRLLGEM